VPEFVKQYDAIVRNLVTKNFTVTRLGHQMDLMAAAIGDAVKSDAAVAFAQFEKHMDPNGNGPATAMTPQPADGGFVVVDPGGPPGGGFGGGFGPGPGGGFGGRGRGGMGGPPLRQFISLRIDSVLEQLDGKREGFTSTGRGGGGGRGFGGPRGFGN
jgi:hypothetical protein